MNKLLLILFTQLQFLSSSYASPIPENKEQFCSRFGSAPTDSETIQDLSVDPVNLMAFKNRGGLFNGGVCWWHSRFQRNVLYLGIFRPDLPRPNTEAIKGLIKSIRAGTSVVSIPGFSNLSEFSQINQALIQKELNSWQLYDGVILGSWIDGLKGDTRVSSGVLQRMMNEVYDYVAVKKKIAYEKLQIKGITSHAWLIVGMKQMPSGIDVGFIDSNNPLMSQVYSYKSGDESFFTKSYGNFVPYLEFKREESRLVDVAMSFCGKKQLSLSQMKDWENDYKRDLKEAKKRR